MQKQFKKRYTLLFVAVSFLWLLNACSSVKPPDFLSIDNIRVVKASISNPEILLDVKYFNPNKKKLVLKSADGDAWVDGKMIGHFNVDTTINIPVKDTFSIPVSLKADLNQLLKNSLQLFLNPEVMIKIEGKAKVGKGGFFIRYPINYEGKQNIKDFLK